MKLPPLAARVQFQGFGLWLPLFLLWPIVALVTLPFLVAAWLWLLVVDFSRGPAQLSAFASGLYAIVCELRGTRVEVEHPRVSVTLT
jgi:hypothetical protein